MPFTLRNIGGSKFGGGVPRENQVKETNAVCGVWGSEGKVFVCTNDNKRLTVTDTVPRSRWAERYDTIIDSSPAHIKAVIQNPRCPSQVYIVFNNSITDCVEHSPSTNQWVKKHSFQLSNAKGAELLSIAFHPNTSMFFWCERRGTSSGLTSCCVCMREVPEDWEVDFVTCIGPVVALVQCCPIMSLYVINKGVCMVPQLPDEEKQLLFFWTFVPRSLKVFIWNHTTVDSLDKTDFRSIIMHLLPAWNSFSLNESEHIISLTTHPTTLELLILDSTLTMSYASIQDGELCIQQLSKLQYDIKKQTVKNIFAFGLFVGIVFESGILDIFDSRSGVALHTITELAGLNLLVWTGAVHGIGVWGSKGIWELKSKSISDVARVMQSSFQSNCENLQESTKDKETNVTEEEKQARKNIISCSECFPGHVSHTRDPISTHCKCHTTNSGPVAATQFLQTWNMLPVAAKVALNSVALKMICSDTKHFQEVDKEHLDILLGNNFQSPIAALALFYQHPCYKGHVLLAVKSFWQNWEQKQTESDENTTKTVLNNLLYPYVKEFITLADKLDGMVTTNKFLPDLERNILSDKAVQPILRRLNLANPDCHSLSRLTYLQGQSIKDVYESLVQMMGLEACSKNNSAPQEIKINSQRWRKILRLEWKDGHWHRNRAAIESTHNPSLSLLCNLLYNEEPDWLLNVYDNGMGMVNAKDADERAKDHVTQSILDCLPALIVDPSPKSAYAHAVLLWTAGQEMQAMQVLVRHQMWFQALDFFSSLTEDTNSYVVLFTMMLKAFLRCRAPKEVFLRALSLVPQEFSTYELLFLMKENGPKCDEPFVDDDHVLTVGDIREHIKDMLTK